MPPRKMAAWTHDVATVGAAVVDEYAVSDQVTVQRIAHAAVERYACVPLDAKLHLSSLLTGPGGGAVNAATTFARLNLRTAAITRVGTDLSGDFLRDFLRNEQIDIRGIQQDRAHPTGKSIIITAPNGERTIFSYRGANAWLDPLAIPAARIRPRWFYVTSLGGKRAPFAALLDYAEALGSRVAWNPGMGDLADGLKLLVPLLRRIDLLILNRTEAAFLAHQPPRHLHRIIHTLAQFPKLALLVSDGANGAYLTHPEGTWHAKSIPGKRTDATGAGDALGSGLVAGLLHSCDLSIALKVGMLNAHGVIRRPGATTGVLTRWPASTALRKVIVKPAAL